MDRFIVWTSQTSIEVTKDLGLPVGESRIHTKEGNAHLVWPPQCVDEVDIDVCNVAALGETPYGIAMNPKDFDILYSTLIYPHLPHLKAQVCECGSAKAKLPFHSDWCPVK